MIASVLVRWLDGELVSTTAAPVTVVNGALVIGSVVLATGTCVVCTAATLAAGVDSIVVFVL